MELELIEQKGNELVFVLKDVNNILANTLRRLMLSEVPTLAIDTVNFIKNDSALYDEIIAHRLGLTPLITDLKSYELPEKCSCKGEGCAKCQLNMTLNTKGQKTVYASELKSQDPKIKPVYGNMPIVKLVKEQKLELEATAVLGYGRQHNKFSPGLIYYKSYPQISITKDFNKGDEAVKICPTKVFENDGKKLKVKHLLNCHLCNACQDAFPKDIKVTPSKTDFVFFIESFGQLTPKEILIEALNIFDNKLDEFAKKLKKS